jgi:hypothetical protein
MSPWRRYRDLDVKEECNLTFLQNLREEVAMDIDEDEDGTQHPRKVQDFGIEVDFDSLDEDEREVVSGFSFNKNLTLSF